MEESSQSFYQDAYEGTKIVLETATHGDAPGSQASEATEITDIRIISGGVGYTKLPTLDKTNKYNTFGQIDNTGQVYSTGVLTTNGTGAKLLPVTNTGMGGVGSFEVVNQGIEYSSAPTLNSFRHAVLKDITGTFNSNTSLTSHTGTVTEFDNDRQLISMNTTPNLVVGNTVSTTTGSGVIANIDTAIGTGQVGTFTETSGNFLDNDGLLSNELQRIQDSFYYQDYSYVVRVGDSINTWRDAIKSTVHPDWLECLW